MNVQPWFSRMLVPGLIGLTGASCNFSPPVKDPAVGMNAKLVLAVPRKHKPQNSAEKFLGMGQTRLLSEKFNMAIVDFGEAITRDPDYADPYLARAEAYVRWGKRAVRLGFDPTIRHQIAAKDFKKAGELDPRNERPFLLGSDLYVWMAENDRKNGKDPSPWYRKAVTILERAVDLHHKPEKFLLHVADLYLVWVTVRTNSGKDPSPQYQAAGNAMIRVGKMESGNPAHFLRAAQIFNSWIAWEKKHNQDIVLQLQKVVRACTELLEGYPSHLEGLRIRGTAAFELRAEWIKQGQDAGRETRRALIDLKAAMKSAPSDWKYAGEVQRMRSLLLPSK